LMSQPRRERGGTVIEGARTDAVLALTERAREVYERRVGHGRHFGGHDADGHSVATLARKRSAETSEQTSTSLDEREAKRRKGEQREGLRRARCGTSCTPSAALLLGVLAAVHET
jgi:hypothetical protein